MRILHIGDIHLGSALEGISRNPELAQVLQAVVRIAEEEKVEAALLAGDIFDTGSPSNESLKLYFDFLNSLQSVGCRQVVVIAGNHDSPTFLSAPQGVLQKMDIHIVATVEPSHPEAEVVALGNAEPPAAYVCAVPFLRVGDVRKEIPEGEDISTSAAAFAQGVAEHYRQVLAKAQEMRGESSAPIIGMGHLYAAGSFFSSTDQEETVGNLREVSLETFGNGFDYLALGHIHKPQSVQGRRTWHYAGSILPMNITESNHAPEVVVLDTADLENYQTREIPYECYNPMETVEGTTLEELREKLQSLNDLGKPVWVKPKFTGTTPAPNWSVQLQKEFRDSKLRFVRPEASHSLLSSSEATEINPLEEVTPEKIFQDTLRRLEPEMEETRRKQFLELFRRAQETALDHSVQTETTGRVGGEHLRFRRLYIRNVNSLYGENLIDFDSPAFHHGVFLISGNTGAGKSSILDAICLALYGQTPRSGELSATQNPVMSDGESEMGAELTFTLGDIEYRASFHQKRTRAGSKTPFGLKEHILYKNGVAENVPAGKVKDEVAKVLGMNLQQFTRCVLLAQGSFDAFLKARPEERADILMKITGTEECNQIGVAINQAFNQIKEEYDNAKAAVDNLQTLSAEERTKKEEALQEALKRQKQLEEAIHTCEACEKTFQEIDKVAEKVQAAAQQLEAASAALTAAEPMRKELDEAQRAQTCQSAYDAFAQNCRERQNLEIELEKFQTEERDLTLLVETSREAKRKASEIYQAKLQEQEQKKPLFDEMRALDVQLANLRQRLVGDRAECKKAETAYKTAQTKFAEATKDWQKAEDAAAEATEYLAEHTSDKELVINAKTWEVKRVALVMAEQAANKLQNEQTQLEAKLETSRARKDKLQAQQQTLATEQTSALQAIDAQRQLQVGLLNGLTSLKDLQALEVSAWKLQDFFTGELQRDSFLRHGEACPLCGSTHHPYCGDVVPPKADYDLKARELHRRIADYEASERGVQTTEAKLHQVEKELALVVARRQTEEKNFQETAQKYAAIREELKIQREAVERDAKNLAAELSAALQVSWTDHSTLPRELDKRLQKYQTALMTAEQLEPKRQVYQTVKASYEGSCGPLENAVKAATAKVETLARQVQDLENTRWTKFGDTAVDAAEKLLSQEVLKAQKASEVAATQLSAAETRLVNNHEAQNGLNGRLQALGLATKSSGQALTTKLQEVGFATVAEFEASRREPARIQELTNMLQQKADSVTRAQSALDERKASLEEWRQKLPADANRAQNLQCLQELQGERTVLQTTINSLGGDLSADAKRRKARAEKEAERQRLEEKYAAWHFLDSHFGSQKDLNRFGRLGQAYTLRRLLHYANQLSFPALTNHFTLVTDKANPLELSVRDHYRGNQVRTSKNLSGGECFEVSLALALGLAEMSAVSQNAHLGNVLIDEGFGALDNQALDSALDLLSQLNASGGKLVGIISHVERLQDCIPAQIHVVSSNGMGRLEGAGVHSQNGARQWSQEHTRQKAKK